MLYQVELDIYWRQVSAIDVLHCCAVVFISVSCIMALCKG